MYQPTMILFYNGSLLLFEGSNVSVCKARLFLRTWNNFSGGWLCCRRHQ